MPYIKEQRRLELAEDLGSRGPENAGELNYEITQAAVKYFRNHARNYATINEIIGAMEAAKLEFYRRVAVPYEEKKIKENGDVYE